MLRAGSSAFGATGLVGGFIAALERAVAAQSAFQPRQFVLHQPRVVLRQPRQFVLRHKRSIPRPRLQARTGETSGQATGRVADANRMHMDCAGAGRKRPDHRGDEDASSDGDLWEKRIDAKWRDKAPRIEMLDESGDYMVIDGMRPRPLAFEGPMADLKAQGMEIPVPKGYRYEQNRPGSWDPDERLKDQDLDGVSGEVIYPGVGLHIVRAPTPNTSTHAAAPTTTGSPILLRPSRAAQGRCPAA
jgi:hypothetical protein